MKKAEGDRVRWDDLARSLRTGEEVFAAEPGLAEELVRKWEEEERIRDDARNLMLLEWARELLLEQAE